MATNSLHPVTTVQLPLRAIVSYLKYHVMSTTCTSLKLEHFWIELHLVQSYLCLNTGWLLLGFFLACLFYRIEYFIWEGPTVITWSNCLTNSKLAKLKHILRALSKCLWNVDRLGALTTSRGCPVPVFEEMLPNVHSEPVLKQLWTIPTRPIWIPGRKAQHLPHHFPSSGSCKEQWGHSQPPFLQTRQDQSPWLLLTGHCFQALHQLCWPLDSRT